MEGTSGVDKERDDVISLGKETNDGDIIKENQEEDKNNDEELVVAYKINEEELMVVDKTNDEEINVLAPKLVV